MNVIIQQQQTVSLSAVNILAVRDLFEEKKIIARIKNIPKMVYLWNGEEEYAEAGVWTNETAKARAEYILSLPEIPWV